MTMKIDDKVDDKKGDDQPTVETQLVELKKEFGELSKQLTSQRRSGGDTAGTMSAIQTLRTHFTSLVDTLRGDENLDESVRKNLDTVHQTSNLENLKAQIRVVNETERDEVLEESGLSWNDERLSSVRDDWAKEDYTGGLRALRKVATAAIRDTANESVDEKVKEQLEAAMKKSGAFHQEQGETTPGSGEIDAVQKLVNRFSLGEKLSMDEMKQASEALDKGVMPKTAVPAE